MTEYLDRIKVLREYLKDRDVLVDALLSENERLSRENHTYRCLLLILRREKNGQTDSKADI